MTGLVRIFLVAMLVSGGAAFATDATGQGAQAQAQKLTPAQEEACARSCNDVSEKDMCMRNRRPEGCTSCKHTESTAKKGTVAGEAWGSDWTVKCP